MYVKDYLAVANHKEPENRQLYRLNVKMRKPTDKRIFMCDSGIDRFGSRHSSCDFWVGTGALEASMHN